MSSDAIIAGVLVQNPFIFISVVFLISMIITTAINIINSINQKGGIKEDDRNDVSREKDVNNKAFKTRILL